MVRVTAIQSATMLYTTSLPHPYRFPTSAMDSDGQRCNVGGEDAMPLVDMCMCLAAAGRENARSGSSSPTADHSRLSEAHLTGF